MDANEPAARGDDVADVELAGTGSCPDGPFPAPNVNNVHQRRRVNPESLALRLGPDLVRDLDALITPGNTEMPSFSVRKELQERYNIDRRHIYDYFHSRGLRVVKEDKHGNPIVVKDFPTPLPNLRPLRQAPIRNHRSYPVAAEKRLLGPRGITKAKPGRPKKIPPVNLNLEIVPVACETNESIESTDTNAPVSEHSADTAPTPTYVTVNPLLPQTPSMDEDSCTFNLATNPLDESFSVKRAIGDIAYAYRHKLVFERMQELTEYPAKLTLTDDLSLSWNEVSPCSASRKGLLLPHVTPLTRDERQAIYKTLSDSLGPAHGIQDCQGTYRKYMQARTKLYYEGPLSVPYHHSQQPVRTSTLSDRKPPLVSNEFRHWLSETRFLRRDGASGSPQFHPSHRNAAVSKQLDLGGVTDQQYRTSTPHWIQTLDELFPMPADHLNNCDALADSPVVHTREVTRMSAHGGVTDERSARGRLLFSDMSSPSLPIPPITSVDETRPASHRQLHGLSGFPGTQEVNTRVAEADSHLRFPEHASCVARSGRLTRSDTQRRGRSISNNVQSRLLSGSPRKPQIRDLDRIRTRPALSRGARRRTPSAAGDI